MMEEALTMALKRTPTLEGHERNRLTGPDRTAELLLLRSERTRARAIVQPNQ